MRLGIFGGTFDPPHVGHQILAAEAYEQLGLERVLWVLTPYPPHKFGQKITPVDQRLQLVSAAIANNAFFELSHVEIRRQPPHYALDTVKILKERYPEAELIYLVGGDSLIDIHSWHEPSSFVRILDGIGVMCRPGEEIELRKLEEQTPGISEKLLFIDAPLLEISSSEIRKRVRLGITYRYYLPPGVYDLIKELGLYWTETVAEGG
jgi:nicotinate-nucleotide adenylyltransferase